MDELSCDTEYVPVAPYRGPVVRTPDIKGVLDDLERNADAMVGGDFNPVHTRALLTRYLRVCRTIPLYRHMLSKAMQVLVRHTLAIPNGRNLRDDELSWPARVAVRLVELGVPDYGGTLLQCVNLGTHLPDHLWFTYADGQNRLMSLDYFSRGSEKLIYRGVYGSTASKLEECACGVWHRPVTVF